MAKKNGHDGKNGSGTPDDSDSSNVARFPSAREREEIERRVKTANDRAPVGAHEPMFNIPPMVKALCGSLIAVQVLMQILEWLPGGDTEAGWPMAIIMNFGFFVLRYSGGMPFGWQGVVSPVTHMFLHGGWLHLAINVTTLAAFGAGLEKTIGGRRLAVLYFVTGIIGAFTHTAMYFAYGASGNATLFPHPEAPLIGASGGISGLFGAVLMMAQARGLMGGYNKLIPFVVLWVVISLFFGVFGMPGAEGPIAWTTHIGGFIAGLLLYRPVAKLKL